VPGTPPIRRALARAAVSALVVTLVVLAPCASAQNAAGSAGHAGAAVPAALRAFFAPLASYPSLQAAAEQVVSAKAQLNAAHDPVSLQASGGYSRFDNNQVDLDPTTPGVQGLPVNGGQVSADVTLRPWLFGDTADQANRSRIQLEQAQLDYDDALTGLQVQALQAAYGVQLAKESLASATEGQTVAQAALDATRLRYGKGAASDRDLRSAETGLVQAKQYVADAEGSLQLAQATLRSLVGEAPPPDVAALSLAVPSGTALSFAKARLSAELAAVSANSAVRSVYPVVQAGYTWNLDPKDSVGVSIESRTLQPKVSFDYQSPGSAYPQDQINGSFQIGVSLTISPGVIDGLNATRAQLQAAREAALAAERGAALQKASLDNDLARARRALTLAERKADDARKTFDEDRSREALGLGTPLQTQQAALDLTQAQLDLQQARQDTLNKTLAYYRFYGKPLVPQPVSEVRP